MGSREGTFRKKTVSTRKLPKYERIHKQNNIRQPRMKNRHKGLEDKMSYEILAKCKPYKIGNKKCQVCVSECYQISKATRSG